MEENKLIEYFDQTTPNNRQKVRMRQAIQSNQKGTEFIAKMRKKRKVVKISIFAASLAAVLLFVVNLSFNSPTVVQGIQIFGENDTLVTLEDKYGSEQIVTGVNKVDARPNLEFFIKGKNIAKIEMTTDTEYITAHDWTETQHEKYWNFEYFQPFDEEQQVYILNEDLIYDKKLVMNFDKDFTEYDQIWFRWYAWDLHKWASEDDFSRFLGRGIEVNDLDEEAKMKLAAASETGIGHIQLDGYPEELLEDTIAIKITDHDGNETNKTIQVKVSNNDARQTVVAAKLIGN